MAAARPIYPAFLWASLLATNLMGASFGAYNLITLHWALGPLPISHHAAHAGVQIWGFVLLFIMGVAYHAVPSMLGGPLVGRRLARATLWLNLAGLLAMTYGRAGVVPGALPALAAGAALLLLSVVGFVAALAATFRRHRRPGEAPFAFMGAGLLWWLAAAGLTIASVVRAIDRDDALWAASWNEPVYAAALLGGAFCWIQGMFLHVGPSFLDLPRPHGGALRASFVLTQLGAGLVVVGRSPLVGDGRPLWAAGLLATALAVFVFTAGLRPLAAAPRRAGDPHFGRLVTAAFACALLAAAMLGLHAGYALAGRELPSIVHDGARHAFALGFVTSILFAVAGRVVPRFGGVPLRWPALRSWGIVLIIAGVLLRQAQIGAALLREPWLYKLSGVSGLIAATGVLLASLSIMATLRASARRRGAPAPDLIQLRRRGGAVTCDGCSSAVPTG